MRTTTANYTKQPPAVLKVSEVAALLRVSKQYVYTLISDGVIKAVGDYGAMRVPTRFLCETYGISKQDIADYFMTKEVE